MKCTEVITAFDSLEAMTQTDILLAKHSRMPGAAPSRWGCLFRPLLEPRVQISYTQMTSKDLFRVNTPVYESDGNCMRWIIPEPPAV